MSHSVSLRDYLPLTDIFFALIDEIERVSTVEDLHAILRSAVELYGLRNVAYLGVNLPGSRVGDRFIAVTYTDEWVKRYVSANYFNIDPVLPGGMRSLIPLDWSVLPSASPKVRTLFGEAREHGVGARGLSFPVRGRLGETALFSITSDVPEAEWEHFKRERMRDLQVLAYHLHGLVLRNAGAVQDDILLSPRELECLQWAACGKTIQDTGDILGISRRTVKFYLEIARHKLNAVNLTQSVAKAVALGLISGKPF
jgi:DNA-binding CsgD family transcriptional regulator